MHTYYYPIEFIVTNITIGKKKRVSFFECPSDLSGMMDLAKVADIILLVIDASFGFEMVYHYKF